MYNTDLPTRAELPTSKQLLRSTFTAIVAATAILVAVVLPAEYNIDPTGIGRVLGLAEMGEIKAQLAEEAERDRLADPAGQQQSSVKKPISIAGFLTGLLISSAQAQEAVAARTDEMTVTLKPGEGTEIKLSMAKGASVKFTWAVTNGAVNFDMHGDSPEGEAISYEKGRAVPNAEGMLVADFDGNHGWFWRNRGSEDVSLTLKTEGAYSDIKQMM
jgi:hypothetical protein